MGKRKASAKPPPRKRMDKLDAVFSCPFCNHGSSIECRIDMHNLIGEATCQICQENFIHRTADCTSVTLPSSPHHRAPPSVRSRILIEEDDENIGHAAVLSLQSRCASPPVLSYRHLAMYLFTLQNESFTEALPVWEIMRA